MAITSMDGIVVGMQSPTPIVKAAFTGQAAGQMHSTWYLAGNPGAGTLGTPGLAGVQLTNPTPGQIPFPSAIVGQRVYLAGADATESGSVGTVMLLDRLWYNTGTAVTTTTAQTINSVSFPARDANNSANGQAVMVGLEVTTATTNAAPVTTISMSYTDSSGTAGNTASIASFPANAVAGTFVPFALAAGDIGVRSIQTLTLGTSLVTGAVSLVAYRVLGVIGVPVPNVSQRLDAIQIGFPTIYDGSVPFLAYILTGTAGGIVTADVTWAQG